MSSKLGTEVTIKPPTVTIKIKDDNEAMMLEMERALTHNPKPELR